MERRVFCHSLGDGKDSLRKHLGHLKRLRDHLVLFLDNVPPLPDGDLDKDAAEKVEAFFVFVTTQLPEERRVDVEVLQFLACSVPDPESWQFVNAPKVRKMTVDVEILSAVQIVASAPCFAVISSGKEGQRYQTRQVDVLAAEARWNEDATLTLESSASWFDLHVFSLSGTLGGAVLIGCVRIPVFGFSESPKECEWDLRDVRIAPSLPVCGSIRLRVSASHVASKTHLAASRGVAVQALPIRLHTGDLVFFKTTRVLTFFTRLLSWSDFDHVGVAIMSSNGKLRLLESVSEPGVIVVDFEKALSMYKNTCSELGVVRFVFDRDEKVAAQAAVFAREVRGLKYNWNLLDMALTSTEEPAEVKDMFCSQLAAAALKRLSILPQGVVADNFLPGTLSSPQLVVEKHVIRDPLVRFCNWNGDGVETLYEAKRASFGKVPAILNAPWKTKKAKEEVVIVGTEENGFLLCEDGEQVPSAFVDLVKN